MTGAVLILTLSGAAVALALWILFRRIRARSQCVRAPAHSAVLATEQPLSYQDEVTVSAGLIGTAGYGDVDGLVKSTGAPSAEATPGEPDRGISDEHLRSPLASNPSVAAQPPELTSEDGPAPAGLHGSHGVYATRPATMAVAATGAGETLVALEPKREVSALGQIERSTEDWQKESGDLVTLVAEYGHTKPVPNEAVGADPSATQKVDSCGPLFSSPDEAPLAQDHGDLAAAVDDAVDDPIPSTLPGEQQEPDALPATMAVTATGAAESLVALEPNREVSALGQTERSTEDWQKESADLVTLVAGYGHTTPVPNEAVGADPSATQKVDSCGPLFSSPDEVPLAQDHGDLAAAIGDAVDAPIPSTLPGEQQEPDAFGDASSQGDHEYKGPPDEERLPEPAAVVDGAALKEIEAGLAALPDAEVEQLLEAEEALAEVAPVPRPRPPRPAQHRDRRGQRRPVQPKAAALPNEISPAPPTALRAPAEARLRLIIHPVRRTVSISVVLARPSGYPDSITLLLGAETEIGAYGEDRYDDVDLEWTTNLLSGEVRLDSREGYQWLRSSRGIHIFSEHPNEQGLMSVGSATLNSASAVICRQEDVEAVRCAATACGSPELISHELWSGVPEGWAVLSGYRPVHASSQSLDPYLSTLDPGVGAEIRLSGGLPVRSGSFAQHSPPKIEIEPFPVGAKVTIDGAPAEMNDDGGWWVTGWDRPGDHLVDVIPGPSLTYRIVGDPWTQGGWEFWDAHADRFQGPNDAPWARAQICGARVSGPSGVHVVAAEPLSSVIALGLRRGVATLRARPDAPIAVGLLREVPAFLISSSGPRRIQGWVDWLVPSVGKQLSQIIDMSWVAAVRSAASRRLPVRADSPAGQEAWRRARARARRYRKAGA